MSDFSETWRHQNNQHLLQMSVFKMLEVGHQAEEELFWHLQFLQFVCLCLFFVYFGLFLIIIALQLTGILNTYYELHYDG